MASVCETIVQRNWCIGCGVCVAACPRKRLHARLNALGSYTPVEEVGCPNETCELCMAVCPANDANANEDELAAERYGKITGIHHTSEAGYHLDAFLGYSTRPGQRESCASGGLLTWLLERLLEKQSVDAVIAVAPTPGTHPLFSFRVCRTVEELRFCSRSCYYPVEASQPLEYVMQNPGRYAITALPCLAKGIRLAQQRIPRLRDRIEYVLGLVCGQGKSTFFSEYICALGGGEARQLHEVRFRVKTPDRPASDYGLRYLSGSQENRTVERTVYWTEGMASPWVDRYFTPVGCNYCDDVFAECADAAFMDAWLPQYSGDWRGHSIAVCRNAHLRSILTEEPGVCLTPVPLETAIQSQEGVLTVKRQGTAVRLEAARRRGIPIPKKRTTPSFACVRYLDRQRIRLGQENAEQTGVLWIRSGRDKGSFDRMLSRVNKRRTFGIRILQLLGRLQRVPWRIVAKIRRSDKG